MFKTSDRASFLILLGLLEYYVLAVLSGDVFAFHSFTREENCIPNLPCTKRPFDNYWASAMFSGPDFIANARFSSPETTLANCFLS